MNALTRFLRQRLKNDYLLVALVSFLPVTEAKSGILLSVAISLEPCFYLPISILSSILGGVISFALCKGLLLFAEKRRTSKIVNELRTKSLKIGGERADFWSICLFVAIPLPLTGIWTGAGVAAVVPLPPLHSLWALTLGDFIAAMIAFLIGNLFSEIAEIIFWALNAVCLVCLALSVILKLLKRKNLKSRIMS